MEQGFVIVIVLIIVVLILIIYALFLRSKNIKQTREINALNVAIEEGKNRENLNNKKIQEKESEINTLKTKYSSIINIDDEVERRKIDLSKQEKTTLNKLEGYELKIGELKSKYDNASKVYENLVHESNLLKNDLEISEFGIYEPYFNYETSEKFKEKIKEIRDILKEMIKSDDAVHGGLNWTVNGSAAQGKKMINRQKKLMLRGFNGECDSFISNVKWNNIQRMEERIRKSRAMINKMGDTQGLEISDEYVNYKIEELKLTYELQLKKHEEKEEQRLIKEQIREEEKARKEFEKAKKSAEKEEKLIEDAMTKARAEISKATEEERLNLEAKLKDLEIKLKDAEEKNKRAISMAQQTKSGHVYVISNLGSFGEDIYKIGMTRRLEPLDRVKELGDASVPFQFDVHAMIYSDNAPELEASLHKAFDNNRVNCVNRRKEYFNISLADIEKVVLENHGEIEFIKVPEAKEYRESLTIRKNMSASNGKNENNYPKIKELFN